MKKITITIIATAAVLLTGCEQKPSANAVSAAAPTTEQPKDINLNGPGQSTPVPGPLVLPEKGKYKY